MNQTIQQFEKNVQNIQFKLYWLVVVETFFQFVNLYSPLLKTVIVIFYLVSGLSSVKHIE